MERERRDSEETEKRRRRDRGKETEERETAREERERERGKRRERGRKRGDGGDRLQAFNPCPSGGAPCSCPQGHQVARLFKGRPWAVQTQERTFYGPAEAPLFHAAREQWPTPTNKKKERRRLERGGAQMCKSLHGPLPRVCWSVDAAGRPQD